MRRAINAALTAGALGLAAAATAAPAAVTWGPETRLSATGVTAETGFNHGALTEDAAGRITAAWAEQDGPADNFRIYTRDRAPAAVWNAPSLAVDFDTTYAGAGLGAKFPALVTLPGDSLLMVWHDYRVDGINNAELFTKLRAPGAGWNGAAAETRLTTSQHPESGGDNSYLPALVVDPAGAAHVAWYDYRFDGSNAEILFKSRAGGAWDTAPGDGPDENVSANAGDSNFPALAAGPDGSLHLAWRDNTGGGFVVRYLRREPGGLWTDPAVLSAPGAAAAGPALAVTPGGTVVAAWTDNRDGLSAVYLREFSGGWGPVHRLSPAGAGAENPALAVTGDGRVHAVWEDTRISVFNRELFYQSAPVGAGWDSTGAGDTRLTVASGKSSRPTLWARADGGLVLLWQDARDGYDAVYAREADPAVTGLDDPPFAGVRLGPNPFSAAVRVASLPPDVHRVAVFDIHGRLVAGLPVQQGAARWDGNGPAGPAPPGAYILAGRVRNGWQPLGKVLRIP